MAGSDWQFPGYDFLLHFPEGDPDEEELDSIFEELEKAKMFQQTSTEDDFYGRQSESGITKWLKDNTEDYDKWLNTHEQERITKEQREDILNTLAYRQMQERFNEYEWEQLTNKENPVIREDLSQLHNLGTRQPLDDYWAEDVSKIQGGHVGKDKFDFMGLSLSPYRQRPGDIGTAGKPLRFEDKQGNEYEQGVPWSGKTFEQLMIGSSRDPKTGASSNTAYHEAYHGLSSLLKLDLSEADVRAFTAIQAPNDYEWTQAIEGQRDVWLRKELSKLNEDNNATMDKMLEKYDAALNLPAKELEKILISEINRVKSNPKFSKLGKPGKKYLEKVEEYK